MRNFDSVHYLGKARTYYRNMKDEKPRQMAGATYLGLGGSVNIITSSIARRTVFEQHSHSRTIKYKRKRLRDIVYSQKYKKKVVARVTFSPLCLLLGCRMRCLSLPTQTAECQQDYEYQVQVRVSVALSAQPALTAG